MEVLLPWEHVLWTGRPFVPPGAFYLLTDFRLVAARGRRSAELALQDIADVEHTRSTWDRLIGTSTVIVRGRNRRQPPVVLRHVRHGAQLAALVELLSGDPQASLDADAVRAALSWNPHASSPRWRHALVTVVAVLAVVATVTFGHRPTSASIVYSPGDAIFPNGQKRDRDEIVLFMETTVMPWARAALGPVKGGADKVTCTTCHGQAPQEQDWQMPGVAALPEPHVRMLGWEIYSAGMNAQMRNAIYGYVAESDNQARAAYMREKVLPGMARLLDRPPYDFTRSYEYNRTRAAFGCYHCHKVK